MKLPIKNNYQYLLTVVYQDSEWGYESSTVVIPELDKTLCENSPTSWRQALTSLYTFYKGGSEDVCDLIREELDKTLKVNGSIEEIYNIGLFKLADDGQDHIEKVINERTH